MSGQGRSSTRRWVVIIVLSSSGSEAVLDVIAWRVANLRKERGWTQQQLAEASGVHRITIVKLEASTLDPRVSTLSRLSLALGVGAGDLLRGGEQTTDGQ